VKTTAICRVKLARTTIDEEEIGTAGVKPDLKRGHVVIERIDPQIDCGRYRAKAVVGDAVNVSADIFRDGPDMLQAVIRYRGPSDSRWLEAPMNFVDNDRWGGSFIPTDIGRYRYTIEAWTDHFGTWRRDLLKRVEAGQDVTLELIEGALLLEARLKSIPAKQRRIVAEAAAGMRTKSRSPADNPEDPRVRAAIDSEVLTIIRTWPDRSGSTTFKPSLELTVDRERARFSAWYELFPRSTGRPGRHGTFRTAVDELPRIAGMGFDVLYLPPIHPIGRTFRKGKNNTLEAGPDDIGVPWAIGTDAGGHTEIHPELGTIEDFDIFLAEAERLGLEIALDFAIQCSPDHPWVTEHPEWFHHRPDGTIKYAENPPKKYQDIYPVNFDTDNKEELWLELKRILDYWISHGVKIFRVDNPHTKSMAFWEWVIEELKSEHPDLILLAEAFTRPKVMQALAKIGFTQSYTYFTWRNTKWELMGYLTELSQTEMARYYRPNFFVNTPDILHEFLQTGGPPAFKIRFVLAALLSPSYGIYSGYELFENVPAHVGSEEYLHSEKYELRHRDYGASDNMTGYIRRVNEIRRKHSAFTELTNLRWHNVDKDNLIAFSKSAADGDSVLVVVSLNPWHWEEGTVQVDLDAVGVRDPARPYEVHDLVTDETFLWHGAPNYVRLEPGSPAHIFEVRV
jgi:starch synthase (maltosyl-transferring)